MPTLKYIYFLDELTNSRQYIQEADATESSDQYMATAKLFTLRGKHAGFIKTVNYNTKMAFKGKMISGVNTNTTLILGGANLTSVSCRFTFASNGTDVLTTPTSSVAVASNGIFQNARPTVTITPITVTKGKQLAPGRMVEVKGG
jgi:hypothetical protein